MKNTGAQRIYLYGTSVSLLIAACVVAFVDFDDSAKPEPEISAQEEKGRPRGKVSERSVRSVEARDHSATLNLPAVLSEASPQVQAIAAINQAVQEARSQLRGLEAPREGLEGNNSDRESFIAKMRAAEDPEERRALMMKHRDAQMARRQDFEDSLSDSQKEFRERLKKIKQLGGLHNGVQRFGWSGELRESAEMLEAEITDFASTAFTSDQASFDQQWNDIQQSHQDLRERGMELRRIASAKENK